MKPSPLVNAVRALVQMQKLREVEFDRITASVDLRPKVSQACRLILFKDQAVADASSTLRVSDATIWRALGKIRAALLSGCECPLCGAPVVKADAPGAAAND